MLKIYSPDKKIRTSKIADAVFKTLKQKEDLKAEIVFVSAEEIRELNKNTRNVDSVTDVLSYPTLDNIRGKILNKKDFPLDIDGKYLAIGSIALCSDRIKEQAKELKHSEVRERTYLIVHGLMHLMGYDHENDDDKKEMRDKEKKALKLLGIEE